MDILSQDAISEKKFEKLNFGENLVSKHFFGCEFIKCNFAEREINRCKFTDCVFIECNLSAIRVTLSSFTNVDFEKSKIIGVNWAYARWPEFKLDSPLSFYHCDISDSSFFELSLPYFILESCKANNVDFRNANLENSSLTYSDFSGSDFVNTKLNKADFTGSENYNIDVFKNEIKNAKFSLPDALALLDSLDIEIIHTIE